jgi:predicted O-methyltransferase YrrM
MDSSNNYQNILRRLEDMAERDYVPILREAERKILMHAVKEAGPKRILEIGTAIGYSALLLHEACPTAEIDTIELDPKRHEIAQNTMLEAGIEDQVRCHLGDAADIIPALRGPYDFVFLDGPKGQYLRYLKAMEPMLSEKAVIAADNVLFRGLVMSKEKVPHKNRTIVTRLRSYIAYVNQNYQTVIYKEGDGLAISKKSSQ